MHFLFLCKSVHPFCEVNFGEDFVHQVTRISSRYQACFKVLMFSSNTTLEAFVLRSACWVAAVVVCVLKCFSRFVMCAHVENRFFLESLSLIDCCIQECCFLL